MQSQLPSIWNHEDNPGLSCDPVTFRHQAWYAAARTSTIYQFRLGDVQPVRRGREAKARWQAEAVGSPTCCLAWRPPTLQAPASKMRHSKYLSKYSQVTRLRITGFLARIDVSCTRLGVDTAAAFLQLQMLFRIF